MADAAERRDTREDGAHDAKAMTTIMIAGAVVLALSFGVRSVFGGVVAPISAEYGWPREIFSLSLAIQNLVWGLAQPFFGMIADRYGDRLALWIGFVCYLAGMVLAVVGQTPLAQHLGTGVLVGMGISGTAFGLVLSVVARAAPPTRRSQYLGYATALGSLGQVAMPTLAGFLLEATDWRTMLTVMTALLLPMAIFIPFLRAPEKPKTPAEAAVTDVGLGTVLARAFGTPSYNLLTLGFFVCGFHLAFIVVHLPAYVAEQCGDVSLGLQAMTIVGAANIVGTLLAGQLGARFPKPYLLSAIYALRALVIFVFISVPTTPFTVVVFALAIGPLWLSTVPLTSGLVVVMFGPRYMGTLYGIVFLSHQVGSFFGVWLGGLMYDIYGSYDTVWWAAIVLGIMAALVHLPVREAPWRPRPA